MKSFSSGLPEQFFGIISVTPHIKVFLSNNLICSSFSLFNKESQLVYRHDIFFCDVMENDSECIGLVALCVLVDTGVAFLVTLEEMEFVGK